MLPFFAWKIFSISFFISLDFYLQVLILLSLLFVNRKTDASTSTMQNIR